MFTTLKKGIISILSTWFRYFYPDNLPQFKRVSHFKVAILIFQGWYFDTLRLTFWYFTVDILDTLRLIFWYFTVDILIFKGWYFKVDVFTFQGLHNWQWLVSGQSFAIQWNSLSKLGELSTNCWSLGRPGRICSSEDFSGTIHQWRHE